MSISTITAPVRRPRFDQRRRPRRGSETGRRPVERGATMGEGTLEDLVVAAMDQLVSSGSATCPACAKPRLTPVGCADCGSRLS